MTNGLSADIIAIMKLYHVSSKYMGDTILLEPRIPIGQSLAELHSPYKKVARICCSDTIKKCLSGLTESKIQKTMYVYQPIGRCVIDWDRPRSACDDWEDTDECWIIEPTTFKYLYSIKCDINTLQYKRIMNDFLKLSV